MKILVPIFLGFYFFLQIRASPLKIHGNGLARAPALAWNFFPHFCNWPKPYKLSKIDPTFLVRYRGGQLSFNISSDVDIDGMISTIFQKQLIKDRVIFVVHGYECSIETEWLYEMSDALMAVEDDTVIVVGWGKGADFLIDYTQAASNTQTMAAAVATATKRLKEIASPYTYCIGHSLGAHICGQAGKLFKFDRISGLDPAGPGFQYCPLNIGLSNVSADCVDAIHTNGESYDGFGTMQPLGHVDFYPNCGRTQPSCWRWEVGCSHDMAVNYFIDSVKGFGSDPHRLPAAQGPCGDSLIDQCTPCGKDCPDQPSCRNGTQSFGYGSVCSDRKFKKCGDSERKGLFGKWFVGVTENGFTNFCVNP